jgi:hypothetical protein
MSLAKSKQLVYFIPMKDSQAFKLILKQKTKTELAKHLGVSKQLLTRWDKVPHQYAEKVAKFTGEPISSVVPELYTAVSGLLEQPVDKFLPGLIRVFRGKSDG